jgi:hypothetical protein
LALALLAAAVVKLQEMECRKRTGEVREKR